MQEKGSSTIKQPNQERDEKTKNPNKLDETKTPSSKQAAQQQKPLRPLPKQPSKLEMPQKKKAQDIKANQEGDERVSAWKVKTGQTGKNYVEGLDRENYAQSWSQGDQIFQHTITQREWERALSESRKKLGKVKSRTLKDQKIAWDPHGLPKGAYMVVEYDTSFENDPNSGEILTMRRGSDGKWRVLTYQVN